MVVCGVVVYLSMVVAYDVVFLERLQAVEGTAKPLDKRPADSNPRLLLAPPQQLDLISPGGQWRVGDFEASCSGEGSLSTPGVLRLQVEDLRSHLNQHVMNTITCVVRHEFSVNVQCA